MVAVAILKRRLREGKTYDDFRNAWFHQTGFGTANRMLAALNVADPREVMVIALTETNAENASQLIEIDAGERFQNPLDEVIEPSIDRTFGILVAEDDFSAAEPLQYAAAAADGQLTDFAELRDALQLTKELLGPSLANRPD